MSIICILTNGTQMEKTVIDKVSCNYEHEDIQVVYKTDKNFKGVIKKDLPFFSDKYLLIMHTKGIEEDMMKEVSNTLDKLDNYDTMLICYNSDVFEFFNNKFQDCKIVNLYNPPEWIVQEHLKIHLKRALPLNVLEHLINKLKYNWKSIDETLMQINNFKEDDTVSDGITIKDINRMISKEPRINFNILMIDLLEGEPMGYHLKALSSYMFATKYTYKEALKAIDFLIEIKKYILVGTLKANNVMEFSKKNNLSYNKILEVYGFVSLASTKLEILFKVKEKLLKYKNDLLGFILDSGIDGVRRKKFERLH